MPIYTYLQTVNINSKENSASELSPVNDIDVNNTKSFNKFSFVPDQEMNG